ncbi:MAG: hypothetical protein U1F36_14130 [Planctomycetota bacterium]
MLHTRPALGAAAILLVVAPLARPLAQSPTDTLPTRFLSQEANARHWVPVQFAPSRAQTTWDSTAIAFPTGTISRLYLRPDAAQTTQAMVAHSLPLTIHMSSVGVPPPGHVIPESYSANRGSDRVQVLGQTNLNFPAFTPSTTSPANWTVSIPITPFAWQSGRNLQIEWDVGTPTAGPASWTWFCDAQRFDPPASYGFFVRNNDRDACPSTGTTYAGDVGGPGELMSIWFNSLSGPNLPAVMFLGTSNQTWGGLTLPIDMAPIGFPGCKVWTDLTAGIATTTDPSGVLGRVAVTLPIPYNNNLAGLRIYSQDFVLDPSFGNGLRASDLGIVQIGGTVPRRQGKHLYTYTTAINDLPEYALDLTPIVGIR